MKRHSFWAGLNGGLRRLGGVGMGLLALGVFGGGWLAESAESSSAQPKGAGITPSIGAQIDLDLEFVDSSGKVAPLSRYFNGERPGAFYVLYRKAARSFNIGKRYLQVALGNIVRRCCQHTLC